MGISLGYLCTLEVGRKWPHLDMLFIIAKALNVRPSELIAALEDELGFNVTKS
ncbi:Helix-turn-helix domain protein (fragment) [uncultured Desulfovibrio sp.]|uniref:Helix-turn-helix domain protein n=2 Tax=Desulfovibrio TaxID=872 RepID=A0A212LBU2_9BACT